MGVFILTLFICSIDVTFPKGLLSVEVRCAKSHIRPVIIRSSSSFKFSFFLKKEGCWYVSKTDVRWRPFIKPFVLFNSRLNSIFYEANQQSMPLLSMKIQNSHCTERTFWNQLISELFRVAATLWLIAIELYVVIYTKTKLLGFWITIIQCRKCSSEYLYINKDDVYVL